ncbi:MAG: hypothetical protein V1815_02420, partial [Candidatus Woesearchaeota archaeon]
MFLFIGFIGTTNITGDIVDIKCIPPLTNIMCAEGCYSTTTYDAQGCEILTCKCSSNSLIRQVSASSDDCGVDVIATTFYLDYGYGYSGVYTTGSGRYHQSFRFTNINIPQGAVIKNAYLKLIAYGSPGTGTAVYTKISAENQDNAIAPTTYADFIGRTLTNTKVDWDITSNW